MRRILTTPQAITIILFLQIIPLILFPPSSFTSGTQEWWLPVLLAIGMLVGVIQIVFLRSLDVRPWLLLSFAHGFNIISRLMMLMPHASYNVGGVWRLDYVYVGLTVTAMVFSWLLLSYFEKPEVRLGLIRTKSEA
jgi:hypothetical protein